MKGFKKEDVEKLHFLSEEEQKILFSFITEIRLTEDEFWEIQDMVEQCTNNNTYGDNPQNENH